MDSVLLACHGSKPRLLPSLIQSAGQLYKKSYLVSNISKAEITLYESQIMPSSQCEVKRHFHETCMLSSCILASSKLLWQFE